uniref:Glycerol-3-phosphate acyltransferase 2, mitochondrial n=1 Tax=Cyprinodon variegatus TaxID=28743 RepID=A0A3Q2DSK4_CYPVA
KKVTVPSRLGMLRPFMGQCCHLCTPDSLMRDQNTFLGFHNLLNVSERQTRYRGWLVRRVCCVLFVSGCKVYGSPVGDRLERVCQSNRYLKRKTNILSDAKFYLFSCIIRNTHFFYFFSLYISMPYPLLSRFMSWVMLKMFSCVFGSIQVNKNHLPALHRAAQEGPPPVYVYVRQSVTDCALIPLLLLCHGLRVPYTVCPLHIKSSVLRSILQKVGVVLLPPSAATELEAETDPLYSAVMTSLVRELLHEGQALSIGVSAESGHGGQWLDRIRQLIKEGSVPDVSLVPVGISYDCVTRTNVKVHSLFKWLLALPWRRPEGTVMIHLSQPFSLKEMYKSGRCRVDGWLPLQDLLLPVILNNRACSVFGKRRMSWFLPTLHPAPELEDGRSERDLSAAIILHLVFSSCTAVMSTSLVSSLMLYKHREGVSTSVLCRDVAWLLEELVFRNRDVGFGGTLPEIVHYSLSMLAPHLIFAAPPGELLILPRPSLASIFHLSLQAKIVTHALILEAIGACAVSAMLCEVVLCGVSGDMEFDVVLGQSELTEKALQLCHLLPPGFMPPCQSAQSLALDAVDSLVRCGILIMEEAPRNVPVCDFWKREEALKWTTSDDPYCSDSDCEEEDLCSYKISQPKQCPEMLFFLCRMLAGHLRALCWTTSALDRIDSPLAGREKSCSEEAARTAVRTLIDLGVSDSLRLCVCVSLNRSAENYSSARC